MHAISIEAREPKRPLPFKTVVASDPCPAVERTVAAALPHVALMFGVKSGLDPERLCAAAGFQAADLADRDRQVPYAWLVALARELGGALENPSIVVELAQFAVLDQFGYLGQAIKHASTPLAALQALVRYARWLDTALQSHELEVAIEADSVAMIVPDVSTERRSWAEAILAGALGVVRALCPQPISPREARFARGPSLHPALQEFFDARVSFAWSDNRLIFDRAPLELASKHADVRTAQCFSAQVDRLVDALDEPFVTLVQRAIAAQLVRGDLSQRRIGRCLALSPRSLQRKLHQHGLKYTTLVHETRKSVAARLLLDPARSVGEVASLVGYQDVSSFARMFKRWTGTSPRTYRDQQRAKSGSTTRSPALVL